MGGKRKDAEKDARRAVIETALAMSRSGLSPGRSGNVSCRWNGGMLITPDASMTDGLLDLFVVRSLSRTAFLRIYPKVYRGEHVSDPRVQIIRASRIRVGLRSDAGSSLSERSESTGIVAYADGERLGPLPVDVRVVPASLRCYAPVRVS